MPATESTLALPVGGPLPQFSLLEPATGRVVESAAFAGSPLLVAFLCNHCPFVEHVAKQIASLDAESKINGWKMVGINSNDPATYPEDSPERMANRAKQWGWTFPYLFDATQEVARAFHAACTPDFFLFDSSGRLAYRGQLDASTPRNGLPCDGAALRKALTLVRAGQRVPEPHLPSIGCNVKWREAPACCSRRA